MEQVKLKAAAGAAASAGQGCFVALGKARGLAGPVFEFSGAVDVRAGDVLFVSGLPRLRLDWRFWAEGEKHGVPVFAATALCDLELAAPAVAALERSGPALAWITLSDKGAAGKRRDESGPMIETVVAGAMPLRLVRGFVLPDEVAGLKALLVELALAQGFEIICTTGGTGVAPRDVTPEATLAVIEKRLPGFERAMTAASLAKTPHGAVSRAVAGTLGQSVIVNLPGSPKAVAECLAPLLPALRHTIEKLGGDPSDCARPA